MAGQDVDLAWAATPDAPGFDPDGSEGLGPLGFYQIGLDPDSGSETRYGANHIASNHHIIPWQRHGNWDEGGTPDGQDHGQALSELDDGRYWIMVSAYSEADGNNPAAGHGTINVGIHQSIHESAAPQSRILFALCLPQIYPVKDIGIGALPIVTTLA